MTPAERPQIDYPAGAGTDEARLAALLDQIDAALGEIDVRGRLLRWDLYHGRHDESASGSPLDAVNRERAAILLDPRLTRALNGWAECAEDPTTRRRAALYARAVALAQVADRPEVFERCNALDGQIVAWRPTLDGTPVEKSTATNVLTTSPDREQRRAAYAANAPLSRRIESDMRALIEARNAAAREAGFPDHAEFVLTHDGLSKQWVRDLFDALAAASEATYQAVLDRAADEIGGPPEIWDLAYIFRKIGQPPDALFPVDGLIPAAHALLRGFGLDPERLPIRVVYRDIPYTGLCMPIRIPDDIRILCNPRDGHNYYRTMFHEFGHALHAAFNRQTSFILQREPSPFGEGMAQAIGYFAHDPDWLRGRGISDHELPALLDARRAFWIHRLRNYMAIAAWEIAVYEDSSGDLDARLGEQQARYLGVPADATPRWAVDSWVTLYPTYRQNYVIADVIGSQLHRALRRDLGTLVGNPDVITRLRDGFWAPGASIEWTEKIAHVTGEPLGAAAIIADMRGSDQPSGDGWDGRPARPQPPTPNTQHPAGG